MSEYKRTALVLGAGGFIGSHMVKRLRSEGYWVRGVDLKYPEFSETEANEFIQGDLRDVDFVRRVIQFKGYQGNFFNEVPYRLIEPFDEIYQFAADMGGAGFIFTGENDADFCVVDISKPWIVKKEKLVSKSKNTSIEDKKLQGKVTNTFVKGKELFKL